MMRETFARNKVLSILVIILLLTNFLLLFFFVWKTPEEAPKTGTSRGRGEVMQLLEKEVGFSKQQLDQYKQLKDQHWERLKPAFGDLRAARDRFYVLLKEDSVADSVLTAAADSIGARQVVIDLQTYRHFRDVRALCTTEQLPRFDSVVQHVMKKMNNFRKSPPKVDSLKK
ncbi:periplasmic heavy metal sensor [Chitinophaga sp. GCM10012297]|uniref:Periplasmic heavy metal sensor n=1 Tax=Chitinophaga chungangae TaxID=2821488 RepID=A0ABS3YA66_9BACT|nr:periplasmic heavy metal sensor [Chitinophaga chungangae]MBO9151564.1 periplasmic heavy metal sensor [Chitinophaga chungangae]